MENAKAKVYGFVSYDRSGKVNWVLEEIGLEREWIKLDYEKGDHVSPAHLARNPMGAIPVLELNGITMRESDAILHFLAETYPEARLLPPLGTQERASCLQWLHFADGTLGYAKMARWPLLTLPAYPEGATTKDGKSAAEALATLKKDTEAEFQKSLTILERHLQGRSFLCETFSVADIALAYSLSWTEIRGDLEPYPALRAYLAAHKTRPAAVRSKVFDRT